MKIVVFWSKFYWNLFPRVQSILISSESGLVSSRRQTVIWTNDGSVDWRIYAPLGVSEWNENIEWYMGWSREWFMRSHKWYMCFYPMLSADSRFWLAKNCDVYTRISPLTSSAWNIIRKERHWWRHNGNHDHRQLSLPLQCDRATLCLYYD